MRYLTKNITLCIYLGVAALRILYIVLLTHPFVMHQVNLSILAGFTGRKDGTIF